MISNSFEELFDRQYLMQLQALHLISRQKMRGRLRAERRSTEKGSSLEFEEYRQFTYGDDYRMVDWKVYARWKQLVVKLFVEEQDLHLHLLVDATASMDWGKPNKFDFARKLVAGFAFMGLSNLDRVSLSPLGLSAKESRRSVRGRSAFLPMMHALAKSPISEKGIGLEREVHDWTLRQHPRGKVIFISDLLGENWEDAVKAIDRLRYQKHEIAVIQVLDSSESKVGDFGEYRFEDQEYGNSEVVVVHSKSKSEYEVNFQSYSKKIESYCYRHQISFLRTWTTDSPWDLMMRAFREGGFLH